MKLTDALGKNLDEPLGARSPSPRNPGREEIHHLTPDDCTNYSVLVTKPAIDRPARHTSPSRDVVDRGSPKSMRDEHCSGRVEKSSVFVRQLLNRREHSRK